MSFAKKRGTQTYTDSVVWFLLQNKELSEL